jgi:2-polyprenyl-3-methyl-5-hydroxy-6-metoxy-1,4-benzoquinol methylase
MSTFEQEVKNSQRFEFGKNWKSFLTTLNDQRIQTAKESIQKMLQVENLNNKSVLDIGSGSGLFSLSARSLGATVHSFDFDPNSVGCTTELRSRYFANDPNWKVEEGSVLDKKYMESLGKFDIVYSWGVLHHTGDMWNAIDNAAARVKEGGTFYIALYNDQGKISKIWKKVKEIYCSGLLGKALISAIYIPYFFFLALVTCIIRRENVFRTYSKNRGMSVTHDWHDWLGGLPFEVASVAATFQFLKKRGFELENIRTVNTLGCNEYVFAKRGS